MQVLQLYQKQQWMDAKKVVRRIVHLVQLFLAMRVSMLPLEIVTCHLRSL